MQHPTYVIERLPQDQGKWRLFIFEQDPDTGSRSITHVYNYDDFLGVAETVENFDHVDYWRCKLEDVPLRFRDHMKRHMLEQRVHYVRDCIRAVADAEADLEARRKELAQALEDLANV